MQSLVVGRQCFLVGLEVSHHLHKAHHLLQGVDVGHLQEALFDVKIVAGTNFGSAGLERCASGPLHIFGIFEDADQDSVDLLTVNRYHTVVGNFEIATGGPDRTVVAHQLGTVGGHQKALVVEAATT